MRTDSTLPGILIYETDPSGHITFGTTTASFPTTAGKFAQGCILQDTTSGKVYRNSGTSAVPVWKTIQTYGTVAKDTSGTTAVNIIDTTVPFAATISGVYVISKDTTAGTITVACTAGTVATIVKGTVSGAMVGAASLSSVAIVAGDTLTAVSSSAGNATVFVALA